jgi:hypothetical protein
MRYSRTYGICGHGKLNLQTQKFIALSLSKGVGSAGVAQIDAASVKGLEGVGELF